MTQDEINRMAREAGLEQVVAINPKDGGIITKSLPPELLERFAALVAAHEREACAKVCEEGWKDGIGAKYQGDVFAAAIRGLK